MSLMTEAFAVEYSEGQIWSYRTRPGENQSTLRINRVERDPKIGSIYHISVLDVKIKNSGSPEGFSFELPHLPVSKKSLDASVLELVGKSEPSLDYMPGYEEWRSQFEIGKAGVFDADVAKIIAIIESAIGGS